MKVRSLVLFMLALLAAPWLVAQQPAPSYQAQFDRGREAFKAGNYKEAIDLLKKATRGEGSACSDCFLFLALTYVHTGDWKQAAASCDRAITLASSDAMRALAHNEKGNVLLGEELDEGKKLDGAEGEYRAATQLGSKVATFHLNLARCLLRESKDEEGKLELQAALDLHPDERTTTEARQLLEDPRRARETLAPDFKISSLQGQQLSLQALRGKVVVMDFWATWCPPCRASVSELKELTRKYPAEKLVLISVSADNEDKQWRDFVAKKDMDWAQYRDSDHKVLDAFAVRAFPTYLVIDGDGFIKERITGLNPQQSVVARLRETLARMPQLEGVARK